MTRVSPIVIEANEIFDALYPSSESRFGKNEDILRSMFAIGYLSGILQKPDQTAAKKVTLIMTLCSDGHEEVCYDGRHCPVCAKIDDLKELQGHLDRANEMIEALNAAE